MRSEQRLLVVVPVAFFVIFRLLYFQFRSATTTLMVFAGVLLAAAGGFVLIWLYGQIWALDFEILGANMRELFQMGTVNLLVAVWVGFIALFGIANDNGVVLATYLDQTFAERTPATREAVREATLVEVSRLDTGRHTTSSSRDTPCRSSPAPRSRGATRPPRTPGSSGAGGAFPRTASPARWPAPSPRAVWSFSL